MTLPRGYSTQINRFVKQVRAKRGMTQREFGKLLGVSRQYVSNVENNVYGRPIEFISKMWRYLDEDQADHLEFIITCALVK